MVSTFTPNKGIEQPANNDYVNTWDVPVNADWSDIDTAFGGSTALNSTGLSGNQTLTLTQYRPLSLLISGTPTATITYVVPSGVGGQWVICNNTTGTPQTVQIKSNAGGASLVIPLNTCTLVSCDGSATGMRFSFTVSPPAGGSNTQIQFNSGGLLSGSASLTWDGTTVSATGLNIAGNVILGSGSGSTLTLNGSTITAPNNLSVGATPALFINTSTNQVGVATSTVGSAALTVAGTIHSTSGGIEFPDSTTQSTAAVNITPGGSTTQVQFNDGGVFNGTSGLIFIKGTNTLTTGTLTLTNALGIAYGGTGKTTGAVTVIVTQTFSASGTYTPNANMLYAMVEAWGGGGGSGGAVGPAIGASSGGGGAGAYSRKTMSKATIGSSQTVTIGGGGSAGSGTGPTAGGNGGTTSLGSLVTAPGGSGSAACNANVGLQAGGAGGVAGTADLAGIGQPGGSTGGYTSGFSAGGQGGSTLVGAGGISVFVNAGGGGFTQVGQAGTGYGSGASGAVVYSGGGTANGAAGQGGYMIVTEYCYA
jgi:hypothetical protein